MSQSVLVIHGAGEPRQRHGKVYWEPLLQDGLGAKYQVRAPRMPSPTDPHYPSWAERIARLIGEVDRPVLVGHSFGASVLLKFVAQAGPRPDFRGLFLVATPFWKADFPEFALTAEQLDRLQSVSPLVFYYSHDDPVVGFDHLGEFARELPRAILRELDGRGHEFNQDSFPELVADILRLAPPKADGSAS
jgi:predicted alpha/beta hydrolase family esterase